MIAYFVHNYSGYSGASKQAQLLAGNVIEDVVFFNYSFERVNNVNVVNMPPYSIMQAIYIVYYIFKLRIKVLHLHGSFNIALALGVILRRKVILKTTLLGDDDFDTFSKKKNWWIKRFFIKRVYKNVVLSKHLVALNSKFLPRDKIILIPNGVEVGECPSFLEKEKNSFCFVGLVCDRKGTYESIEYYLSNYAYLPEAKFYIIGPYGNDLKNSEYSEDYFNKCLDLIKKSKYKDSVFFIGQVPKKETIKLMRRCKALIFLSKKEGMPNVVLESLANNVVPITYSLDGVSEEMFSNKIHGFIINDKDEKVDIYEIDKLIIKKIPYGQALEKFHIDVVAKKYTLLYSKARCRAQ